MKVKCRSGKTSRATCGLKGAHPFRWNIVQGQVSYKNTNVLASANIDRHYGPVMGCCNEIHREKCKGGLNMCTVELNEGGRYLTLKSNSQSARFHAIWLRDNAWDAATRAPENGQRLIALRDIPEDTLINATETAGKVLNVTFMPEGKTVTFDINWLLRHAYDPPCDRAGGWTGPGVKTWDGRLKSQVPVADFGSVSSDPVALKNWLGQIARFGFGKLSNGPVRYQP